MLDLEAYWYIAYRMSPLFVGVEDQIDLRTSPRSQQTYQGDLSSGRGTYPVRSSVVFRNGNPPFRPPVADVNQVQKSRVSVRGLGRSHFFTVWALKREDRRRVRASACARECRC